MDLIRFASIIVTYRCNAKCHMCNTWKHPTKKEDEIGIDVNGQPIFEDVARTAEDRVIVCTRLVSSIGDAKNL